MLGTNNIISKDSLVKLVAKKKYKYLDIYHEKRNFFFQGLPPLLLLFFSIKSGFSQGNQNSNPIFFDKVIGIENTGLYQGILYSEKYRTINEKTPYLISGKEFVEGSVYYEGQQYDGVKLKYNVFEDVVLVKLVSHVGGGGTLQLLNNYLEYFTIRDRKFTKIEKQDAPSIGVYGHFEVVLTSPYFTLLIKHVKRDFDRKDRKSVYHEFIPGKNHYVLLYKEKYYKVNSKKDITAIFPKQKKHIDKFYNIANKLKDKNPNRFHISLIKSIETVLPEKAN
jgi:hypothetical protein